MTLSIAYRYDCDGGCGAVETEARSGGPEGWTLVGQGKDLCRSCTERELESADHSVPAGVVLTMVEACP